MLNKKKVDRHNRFIENHTVSDYVDHFFPDEGQLCFFVKVNLLSTPTNTIFSLTFI